MVTPSGLRTTRPRTAPGRRLAAVLCAMLLWTGASGSASAQTEGSAGRGPETLPVIDLSAPLPATVRQPLEQAAEVPNVRTPAFGNGQPGHPDAPSVPQAPARTVETVIPTGLPRAGDGSTAMTFTRGAVGRLTAAVAWPCW